MIQKAFRAWARKNRIPESEHYKLLPVWRAAVKWARAQ